MLESFEVYLKAQGKSEDTIKAYMRTIMRFQKDRLGTADKDLFAGNFQKWILSSGKSFATQNAHKSAGQAYYQFLTHGKGKKLNFPSPTTTYTASTSTPWLTKQQYEQLLIIMKRISNRADLYRRNVTIIETFVYTGLKVSQVADLSVGDVSFRNNCIKSGEQRIPLARQLRESLKLWIEHRRDLRYLDSDERKKAPLFTSRNGRRMSRRTISLMIESYYLPGMKITPEILRHTFAKWVLMATNNDTEFVRKLLGSAYSRYAEPESQYDVDRLQELPMP